RWFECRWRVHTWIRKAGREEARVPASMAGACGCRPRAADVDRPCGRPADRLLRHIRKQRAGPAPTDECEGALGPRQTLRCAHRLVCQMELSIPPHGIGL